jgi:RimJ/RimL family protein N-acetyltransferase
VGTYLETGRLILRWFTASDGPALAELNSDPEVTFFINGGRPIPLAEIEASYLPAYLGYPERYQGYGFWAVVEKSTGDFLGWFHLRPDADGPADEPELGYRLRRSAWGQGYATEGSRALVDKAFGELGAARVRAETMVVNTRSRRVMEKAGLRQVRVFQADWPDRIPGDEHGDVEYALTRDEWAAQRP